MSASYRFEPSKTAQNRRTMAEKLVTDAGLRIMRSHTSIAVYDKSFYSVYRKNRSQRVDAKPFPLRLFWTTFYSIEDRFKLISETLTERIYGTNYFALLESQDAPEED